MSAPATDESGWPLTKADRQWNQWQLFVVLLVTAAATWCYIIGEYVGYYLNLKMGFAAMTAGSHDRHAAGDACRGADRDALSASIPLPPRSRSSVTAVGSSPYSCNTPRSSGGTACS